WLVRFDFGHRRYRTTLRRTSTIAASSSGSRVPHAVRYNTRGTGWSNALWSRPGRALAAVFSSHPSRHHSNHNKNRRQGNARERILMAKLNINGSLRDVQVEPDTPLLWVIREQVGLTGTKYGCGVAQCGACTVHLNGEAVRSCSLPVSEA